MSRKDEYARATFYEVMANRDAYSPSRSPGPSRTRREQAHRESSSSRGSGVPRSHHSKADSQTMAELQENYSTVVGGFKILEVKLQQTQDRLAAAEAANCSTHEDCISEINRLKDELTACKVKLDMSEMRSASVSGLIMEAVTCQICHSLPAQPYSTDCRHLYCATCLHEWWNKSNKPSCFTCHQLCLYPPVRDTVHGLLLWAHEDSGKGNGVELDEDNHFFSQFFTPANQASTMYDNGGYGDQGGEERMVVESLVEVEHALVRSEVESAVGVEHAPAIRSEGG